MRCIYCYTENEEAVSFCMNCGRRLRKTSDTEKQSYISYGHLDSQEIVKNRSELTIEAFKIVLSDVIAVAIVIAMLGGMLYGFYKQTSVKEYTSRNLYTHTI